MNALGASEQGRGAGTRRRRAGRRAVLGGALALVGPVGLAACAGPGAGSPVGPPGGAAPGTGGAKGKLAWLVRTNPLENPWEQDVVLPALRERAPGVEIDLQITADVWNEKVFAMQAGREIRVMVAPEVVDDIEAQVLARDIAKQIEEELTYPGQIKVTVVRESRATETAR